MQKIGNQSMPKNLLWEKMLGFPNLYLYYMYLVGASSCISQDARLNFARLSHKTWGARFARQRFTKNSILFSKNGVFSKNSSNESSKKIF